MLSYIDLCEDVRRIITSNICDSSKIVMSMTCKKLRKVASTVKSTYVNAACTDGSLTVFNLLKPYKHKVTDDDFVSIGMFGDSPLLHHVIKRYPVRGKNVFRGILRTGNSELIDMIDKMYHPVWSNYPKDVIKSGRVDILDTFYDNISWNRINNRIITMNAFPNIPMLEYLKFKNVFMEIYLCELLCKYNDINVLEWVLNEYREPYIKILNSSIKYDRMDIFLHMIEYSNEMDDYVNGALIMNNSDIDDHRKIEYLRILHENAMLELRAYIFTMINTPLLANFIVDIIIESNNLKLIEYLCLIDYMPALHRVVEHYGHMNKKYLTTAIQYKSSTVVDKIHYILDYYSNHPQEECDTINIVKYALESKLDDDVIDKLITFCDSRGHFELDTNNFYSISLIKYYIKKNPDKLDYVINSCAKHGYSQNIEYIIQNYGNPNNVGFEKMSRTCSKEVIIIICKLGYEVTPKILSRVAIRFPEILSYMLSLSKIEQEKF